MNKAELVEALEERLGSRKLATDAVEAVIDTIVRSVAKGERVAISGFGTFERVARAARTGRNPRTGTPVRIKKTTVPKFKPGTAFKAFVAAPRSMPSVAATGGVAVTSRGLSTPAPAPAKKTATKAAPAKKTATRAATKTATKAAPVKKTATKSAGASKTTATKAAATRTGTAKTAATKATPAKKTTAAAKKAPAKRVAKKA